MSNNDPEEPSPEVKLEVSRILYEGAWVSLLAAQEQLRKAEENHKLCLGELVKALMLRRIDTQLSEHYGEDPEDGE